MIRLGGEHPGARLELGAGQKRLAIARVELVDRLPTQRELVPVAVGGSSRTASHSPSGTF